MAVLEITKDNFRPTYEQNNLVIVDFWADWCGPCKNFAPVFERVAEKHPDIKFGKVDTEAEAELAGHFGIMSIPTLMVIREGIELYCEPGALSEKELGELIERARALDMDELKKKIAAEEAGAEKP